jgi:hypothetical protein
VNINSQSLSSLASSSPLAQATQLSTAPTLDAASVTSATAVDVSKPGELLAALQQLQQEDPAKFKDVVAQLAKEVRDQAGQATGRQADALTRFADRLDTVASTGDLSALRPHAHGGGHRARGAQAYQAAQASSGVAPGGQADTDGDHEGGGAASGPSSTSASPRSELDTLLANLLKTVNDALTGGSVTSGSTGVGPSSAPAI